MWTVLVVSQRNSWLRVRGGACFGFSGEASTFNIIARDRFGNLLEYKPFEIMPDAFEVRISMGFQ